MARPAKYKYNIVKIMDTENTQKEDGSYPSVPEIARANKWPVKNTEQWLKRNYIKLVEREVTYIKRSKRI